MAIQRSVRPTAGPRPPHPGQPGTDLVLVPAQQDPIGAVRDIDSCYVVATAWSTEREDGLFGELLDMPGTRGAALARLDWCPPPPDKDCP